LQRLRLPPGANTNVPVVAITALPVVPAGILSSFSATIRKPVDPAVLASTVAGVFDKQSGAERATR
jgi:hypothetical protein